MKIYIAGPITGDPDYKKKFDAVARIFSQSWPNGQVLNPATLPEGMKSADYMAICLPMLLRSQVAIFLPGWENSKGAVIEKNLAEYAGISVVTMSLTDFAELMELPREET